jgi:hypothetical protein
MSRKIEGKLPSREGIGEPKSKAKPLANTTRTLIPLHQITSGDKGHIGGGLRTHV